MSKKHVVCFDELKEYSFRHCICGACGKGQQKSIDCTTQPVTQRIFFDVLDHGRVIYSGPDIVEAINAYNNA
jgi:hypothetical protein